MSVFFSTTAPKRSPFFLTTTLVGWIQDFPCGRENMFLYFFFSVYFLIISACFHEIREDIKSLIRWKLWWNRCVMAILEKQHLWSFYTYVDWASRVAIVWLKSTRYNCNLLVGWHTWAWLGTAKNASGNAVFGLVHVTWVTGISRMVWLPAFWLLREGGYNKSCINIDLNMGMLEMRSLNRTCMVPSLNNSIHC